MVCTWVSFRRSPVAPLRESRSLPARSMRFSTPCTVCSVLWNLKHANLMRINCTGTQKLERNHQEPMIRMAKMCTSLTPEILRVKTQWLLDDCSFIAVLPTDLQTQHQVSAIQQVKISRKELHNQLRLPSIYWRIGHSIYLSWDARCKRFETSFQFVTSTSVKSETLVLPFTSCFTTYICFASPVTGPFTNKSRMVSL